MMAQEAKGNEEIDVFYAWNPKVASRTLDDTAFVLLQSSMVSLNDVGTYLWEHFKKGSTVEEAVTAVVSEFETTDDVARKDIVEFVNSLLNKNLLVIDDSRSQGGVS
jgi:hypothetical protein